MSTTKQYPSNTYILDLIFVLHKLEVIDYMDPRYPNLGIGDW